MNVKEMRKAIKDLPDDMLVCGVGHYGEPLEVCRPVVLPVRWPEAQNRFQALTIEMEDAGEEPD